MNNNLLKPVFIFIISISFFHAYSQKNYSDITGVWLTPKNRSAIKIIEKDNICYGQIVWQKEPNDQNGNPKKDINNPNPKLRHKPLTGLVIMKNLKYEKNENCLKGTIYNPESGNTYKIKVELLNPETLKVRGYIGFSFIGKTSVWKKKIEDI
ncbi:MAG: DUF2147 domain-containing protein [Bacteroidales bacterium]|nr:DUF2147 domain-containing protein [Bacteroidales bacterium]